MCRSRYLARYIGGGCFFWVRRIGIYLVKCVHVLSVQLRRCGSFCLIRSCGYVCAWVWVGRAVGVYGCMTWLGAKACVHLSRCTVLVYSEHRLMGIMLPCY